MKEFDYTLDYDNIDFRENPELYRIGRGEQGVLLVEPYKSEICQHWRFRTPEIAEASSNRITAMFHDYIVRGEFVGADMARKFLMMGWPRARRYANHRSGKKYDENGNIGKSGKVDKFLYDQFIDNFFEQKTLEDLVKEKNEKRI